jgi:hypothetical protein
MHRQSPDAASIMALPHARHSRLLATVRKLAASENVRYGDAFDLIEAARMSAGISVLDIEMVQPDAQTAVPFSAPSKGPASDYEALVTHHVHQLTVIKGGR